MAFDGFVTKAIVNELSDVLLDAKVNKVFEPNSNEIIINFYKNSNKYNLSINIDCSNCRINLTSHLKKNPNNPPPFCMLLRKYLEGSKLTNIYSIGLDRIIVIEFEGYDSSIKDTSTKTLVVELMGKHSNIILLNNNNVIIDSIRHITTPNSYRYIFPGAIYSFPISNKNDFLLLDYNSFLKIVKLYKQDLISIIQSNFIGFSKSNLKFIFESLKINSNEFSESDIKKLFNYLISINEHILLNKVCFFNSNVENKQDFAIDICEDAKALSINESIDSFYYKKESYEEFKIKRNHLLKDILSKLKKLNCKLKNIDIKLQECSNMDTYKIYGELITSNLYKINSNSHLDQIELENYYSNNTPIIVKLDIKYSVIQNAKNFFKKYTKLKNALKIVSLQKEEVKLEITYLESIVYEIQNSKELEDLENITVELYENNIIMLPKIKSKEKTIKNKGFFSPKKETINGFEVLIGRNNKENDYLTLKYASKEDIWFHVKDFHGSHVVLRINGKQVNDTILIKCAKLAAFYSQAKASTKVLVQYTKIKNISKPKNSRPGMVVFNNYKTLLVSPKIEE